METFKEQLKDKKYLEWIPFLLIPLTAVKTADFLFIVLSMLFAVFSTKYAIENRKENDGISYLLQNIITDILFIFYMISGYPVAIFLAYTLTLVTGYSTWKKKDFAAYLLAAYISQMIMVLFVDPEACWSYKYTLLITGYNLSIIACLTALKNFRFAVTIHFLFQAILRIANVYYGKYRFSTISIMDIFSLPTFFTIAGEYDFTPDPLIITYVIICIILFIPFLFMKNYNLNEKKMMKPITCIAAIAMFFLVGERAYLNWQSVETRSIYFFDAFALSAVEQFNIIVDTPNKKSQEEIVHQFSSEVFEEGEIQPNIITIMSESYADTVKALGIEVSRDPLKGLYELEGNSAKIGTVHVNTVGGGTSVSEWGYLTGLNCADYSILRIPFSTDVKTNYAFTADPLYDGYEKVFRHPFRDTGWNRPNVYKTLEYDRILFENSMEVAQDEKVRGYIGDQWLTNDIIREIEQAEKPLFNMNVSMQNHGGYDPETNELSTDRIEVYGDTLEENEKETLEYFLQLEELSTNALVELVDYLEAHPEYPTILIFFGDHYPSDIAMPEDGVSKSLETPYLVYYNYKELDDMPEAMDLSLLLPNAKKAAGLPLTAWEQYLLSLNGNTAPREMILARIKYGAF